MKNDLTKLLSSIILCVGTLFISSLIVACGGDDDEELTDNQKQKQEEQTTPKTDEETGDHACPDSNHPHAIDLGLPSGTLWACCNVGASKPEDYGNYYAWGETTTKSDYSWDNYKWGSASNNLTKYNTKSSYGTVDNKTTLDLADDAARANWGSPWRMPSLTQVEELLNNTTSTWTTENGVAGRKFTGSNGGTVFLPAAGDRWDSDLYGAGSNGLYWSSTLYESLPSNACRLYFNSDLADRSRSRRGSGQSVRPVR